MAAPSFSLAQAKVAHIGILSARSRSTPAQPDVYLDAFVRGMQDLGYLEGKNLRIEWRFADGKFERLPALAVELVKTNPEVIVSHSTPGTLALQKATRTVPIVMTSISDPVGSGLVASLARPGANITGISLRTEDVSVKHVELVQAIVPAASRLGVFLNPDTAFHPRILKNIQAAAQPRGFRVAWVEARNADEIVRGFQKLAREGMQAVVFLSDSFFNLQRRQIAEVALEHRLPTIYVDRVNVEAGGLISYGTDVRESYRRAALYVDRILKGAKAGELPIEEPSSYHLAINRRTAKALAITIPAELLVRADQVID